MMMKYMIKFQINNHDEIISKQDIQNIMQTIIHIKLYFATETLRISAAESIE